VGKRVQEGKKEISMGKFARSTKPITCRIEEENIGRKGKKKKPLGGEKNYVAGACPFKGTY